MEMIARYRGALLGLAAGDALGTAVEFAAPGSFSPLTDMIGGGPFNLQPGQWTDDTSMALCLAASLVECSGFDPVDQLRHYVRWWREGYLSSTGRCFDIGNTTRTALMQFERTGDPYPGPTDSHSAGNGSLMRLAPIPLAYAREPQLAIEYAAHSSRTTHGARTCLDACRYFAGLIVGALQGVDKDALLQPHFCPIGGYWQTHPLCPEIEAVAAGSYKGAGARIQGTGYVVKSLEAALWAFWHSNDYREGCLLAANLGDDADTTAAVYGQLAGAYYGEEGIPAEWRARLAQRERIVELADDLYELLRSCNS